MSCPKCNASNAALYRNQRALAGGTWVEETSCLLCGYTKSDPIYPVAPRSETNRPTDRPSTKTRKQVSCTLAGCDGLYSPGNSKHHLCPSCSTKMHRWRCAKKGTPAPMIKQADGWITNPERKGAA